MRTHTGSAGGVAYASDFGRFGSTLDRLLQSGGNLSQMRTNTFLTEEDWRVIDSAVVRAAEQRLTIVADLNAAGLIHPLDGLGVLESEFHRISDMEPAEQSMSGSTRGEKDLPDTAISIVPIPITFKEWEIEGRFLLSSQRRGEPIDVSAAFAAARQVSEKLEDMVFNGGDIVLGGNQIYGLTNHPDRGTHTISVSWTTAGGAAILADVIAMLNVANGQDYYGPFDVYVGGNYWTPLMDDFKTNSDKTILQRLLELPDIRSIKPADQLADSNVLMVQMTPDVVDLAVAQELDTVDWETQGGAIQHFKTMAAMAPRVKSDYSGKSGIVHGS